MLAKGFQISSSLQKYEIGEPVLWRSLDDVLQREDTICGDADDRLGTVLKDYWPYM